MGKEKEIVGQQGSLSAFRTLTLQNLISLHKWLTKSFIFFLSQRKEKLLSVLISPCYKDEVNFSLDTKKFESRRPFPIC